MKKKLLVSLLLLVAMCGINSCAPSLGDEVGVEKIAAVEPDNSEHVVFGDHRVRVLKFLDARPDKVIADVNGRSLMPRGDIGLSVQRAVERHFAKLGIRSALFEAPSTISGEVQEWTVNVEPRFPATRVSSKASLKIELYNKQNHIIYRAKYSGSADYDYPFVGEDTLEQLLSKSMQEAIGAALKDEQLLQKIANAK